MNNFTLLPSANWNMSHMLVVNEAGNVCAYGSRGDILIIKNADKDNLCQLDNKIISSAHKNARVMGLAFVKCEIEGVMMELIASCGDDGRLRIWDYDLGVATHKTSLKDKNSSTPMKFVDIDYSLRTSSIICIAEQGYVVKWDVVQNKIWTFGISVKSTLNCVSVCPHADDLIAIGSQFGRVLVYSVRGEGKLIHRLLCHSSDVTSVSWCPVPYNVLHLNKQHPENFDVEEFKNTDKTFLLASCCSDLTIYVSRAGTDNHCETLIKLPAKPLVNSTSRYGTQRNSNLDRGRIVKWIYPHVIVTFTNYNEMVSLYLCNFQKKISAPEMDQSSMSMKVTPLKYDARSLHNIHKRNISSFAICVFNREEIDFRVWSCSFDKIIVRSGYRKNYKEKSMVLPLLSGFIFSMDISSVNPDLLAIGTGDGKISIWNLSAGNVIDIKTLSKKIDHKVMSVLWHPHYEGIFAFGTYEGRVGLFDVSQGGYMPTLFKTFHQKAVYRLCWTPPIYVDDSDCEVKNKFKFCDNLVLLAVVDGDILQYNPKRMDELPVSLSQAVFSKYDKKCDSCVEVNGKLCSCQNKSDMCYEENRDVIIIGYRAGEIRVFSAKTHELLHVISDQTKTIMSVTWHPISVFDSPNQISPYRNWLAVAGEKVLVYEVIGETSPKKVASLEVHTSRVLHVAWNPHTDGRLVTCSGDSTAIIWDVINQAVLGRYTKHCAQILCGLWSRTNRDIVITGSSDFTCRVWSISRDTVSTVEEKKKNYFVSEPCIVNAFKTLENAEKPAAMKSLKNPTFFPSTSHEFYSSRLLDEVFEQAILKHDPSFVKTNSGKCSKHNSSIQNDSFTSPEDSFNAQESELEHVSVLNQSKSTSPNKSDQTKKWHSKHSYASLFGSKEELLDLMCEEERVLEDCESNDYLILVQARDALKTKIMEAMEKNKVTNYHLALAASVSPKLYKDACHVYIEQMILADNIFEAVNFQLALGRDSDAITLLCDKKRFKEAFALARLRLDDDLAVREVLTKWIHFCNSGGSYRLGAHCYMYLKEEEKAGNLLSRSKLLKDVLLAAKLLKYYHPDRAVELATECFRRHLTSLSQQNVREIFSSFPELKFLEPWYFSWKYFTQERPSTACITKWVIGILKNTLSIPDDFIKSYDCVDFVKLQLAVVDNSFQMNYDELNLYVSAQAALYVSGSVEPNHAVSALRHFVRALSMCYNYRLINSNQVYSDKAYPMMRLLKLMFPSGILKKCEPKTFDHNSPLCISVNAFICDFVVTWLTACDDLPKSLKSLRPPLQREGETPIGLETDELCKGKEDSSNHAEDIDFTEDIEAALDIIANKKVKLKKITLLLSNFLDDMLNTETVEYFKNISKLKKYDSGSAPTGCVKSTDLKGNSNYVEEIESDNSILNGDSVENKLTIDSTQIKSDTLLNQCNGEKPDQHFSVENGRQDEMKRLRISVERFEKERMSAPNPFIFIVMLKVFVAKHKEAEPELASELETLLELTIKKHGVMED